jgi:hypothetical protein
MYVYYLLFKTEGKDDGYERQYIITKVAKTQVEINPNVIQHSNYRKLIKFCEPRPEKKVIVIKKARTPWTFGASIWTFYDYKLEGEPEEYINELFEYDFTRCGLIKEAKTDEAHIQLKTMLRSYYDKMYFLILK